MISRSPTGSGPVDGRVWTKASRAVAHGQDHAASLGLEHDARHRDGLREDTACALVGLFTRVAEGGDEIMKTQPRPPQGPNVRWTPVAGVVHLRVRTMQGRADLTHLVVGVKVKIGDGNVVLALEDANAVCGGLDTDRATVRSAAHAQSPVGRNGPLLGDGDGLIQTGRSTDNLVAEIEDAGTVVPGTAMKTGVRAPGSDRPR